MNTNKINNKLLLIILSMIFVVTGCSTEGQNESNKTQAEQPVENVEANNESEEKEKEEKEEDYEEVSGKLEVHFIDVGQGDSVLIKQGNHNMLIDAGENWKGQDVVDYLRNEGVETLDYVIGTHPHSDHIGGLDDVIYAFDTKNVIMPDKMHTTKTFEDVLEAISYKDLKITNPVVGDTIALGDAKFTIVGPNSESYSNLNDYSVAVRLVYGETSFMLTGDAEKGAEQEMVDNGEELKADVLKAGHHGSNTSSIDSFVNAVNPEYVVMQVGEDNKYNHPDQDIVDKFNNMGVEIYRNDEHGTIIAESDGKQINFNIMKGKTPPKSERVTTPSEQTSSNSEEKTSEEDDEEDPIENMKYIGTKTSKIVHEEDCHHVPGENNREYFDDLDDAFEQGYKACKVCKPDK